MKKIAIIIILGCIGLLAFAQDNSVKLRIDTSLQEMQNLYSELPVKIDKDGDKYLFQEAENSWIFYYFNEDDLCNVQTHIYHKSFVTSLLKSLNSKDYLKLSNTEYLRIDYNRIVKFTIEVDLEYDVVVLLATKE